MLLQVTSFGSVSHPIFCVIAWRMINPNVLQLRWLSMFLVKISTIISSSNMCVRMCSKKEIRKKKKNKSSSLRSFSPCSEFDPHWLSHYTGPLTDALNPRKYLKNAILNVSPHCESISRHRFFQLQLSARRK